MEYSLIFTFTIKRVRICQPIDMRHSSVGDVVSTNARVDKGGGLKFR